MSKYTFMIFRTAYGKEAFLTTEAQAQDVIAQWNRKAENISFINYHDATNLKKTSVVSRKNSVVYGIEVRYEEGMK